MEKLQVVAGILILAALLLIINMIRKRRLELKYALAWIGVLAVVLVVDMFPPILYLISYMLGIATPVNTLFVLAFCFSIVLIFVLTVAVSRLAEKVKKLSQAVAINEKRIEELIKGEKKDEENNCNGM